jgi:hypothetical protein
MAMGTRSLLAEAEGGEMGRKGRGSGLTPGGGGKGVGGGGRRSDKGGHRGLGSESSASFFPKIFQINLNGFD